jgi:uncharacterized membrane protein
MVLAFGLMYGCAALIWFAVAAGIYFIFGWIGVTVLAVYLALDWTIHSAVRGGIIAARQ